MSIIEIVKNLINVRTERVDSYRLQVDAIWDAAYGNSLNGFLCP